MKKHILIISLVIALIAICFSSCKSDEKLTFDSKILNLGGKEWVNGPLDDWLYDAYTKDYNINVKYRWDASEVDVDYRVTPISEDRVKPFMSAVKKIWIEPYERVASSQFIKTICPKTYVLIGSPKYSSSGKTVGEAEGGRKVIIYRLNQYRLGQADNDIDFLRDALKTVHHEFAHTMHQTIMYPPEFEKITPESYDGTNWNARTEEQALSLGFLSSYASSGANEDFAETLSRVLLWGTDWLSAQMASAKALYLANLEAAKVNPDVIKLPRDPSIAIQAKVDFVAKYMQTTWSINLFDDPVAGKGLITLVQDALNDIRMNGPYIVEP